MEGNTGRYSNQNNSTIHSLYCQIINEKKNIKESYLIYLRSTKKTDQILLFDHIKWLNKLLATANNNRKSSLQSINEPLSEKSMSCPLNLADS